MLVQTKNLPDRLPDVYIVGINAQQDDSSEEDDDDDEEDSEEDDGHRLHELKIQVYNCTVEFKKKRKLVVSISLHCITSHCPIFLLCLIGNTVLCS